MVMPTLEKIYHEIKSLRRDLSMFIPTEYRLIGKSASKLDRRVSSAMKEYQTGRTKRIHSSADLLG